MRRGGGGGSSRLDERFNAVERGLERMERAVKEEMSRGRDEAGANAMQGREELSRTLNAFGETVSNAVSRLTQLSEQKLEHVREAVEKRLENIREENSRKLEQMRETVDGRLHDTLEKRLGETFTLMSERLERVHEGLGEMRSLASGVGDLKRVLTNVKARGVWGEVQLEALLEEILTPEQFARNVATKRGGSERVEFAVRMPGREEGSDGEVWLPIDSKFPMEYYERLVEAQERGETGLVEDAARELEARIKGEARNIKEKYVEPPGTTDFAIMFLPTESLYAEVLRRPGLCGALQREQNVIITGPTTLAALLSSLRVGFRTIAIEKRSSEVWSLLGEIKTDFGKFGEYLDKTKKKLEEATNSIEKATRKRQKIEMKLEQVQRLPAGTELELFSGEEEEPQQPAGQG
ncbi:MAG: DNA recombination protein RmuC [bacterium]